MVSCKVSGLGCHYSCPGEYSHKFRIRVEGTSVIIGPKCNEGPICNNIWTQA